MSDIQHINFWKKLQLFSGLGLAVHKKGGLGFF